MKKDLWRSGWALSFAWGMALILSLGCGGKHPDVGPIEKGPARVKIFLESPEISTLGKIDGPYILISAESPTLIKMGGLDQNLNAKTEFFVLAGLQDDEYDLSLDAEALKKLTPSDIETMKQRQKAIWEFKRSALEKLCEDKDLWVLRLSDTSPALVYLLQPDRVQTDNGVQQARGQAQVINAVLLRQGAANMWLDGSDYPLYDQMLECQLFAYVTSQHLREKKTPQEDLWTRFEMTLPKAVDFSPQLTEMRTQLGYK